jgi:hypothetical protein
VVVNLGNSPAEVPLGLPVREILLASADAAPAATSLTVPRESFAVVKL